MKTLVSNELILQAHEEASDKWKSLIEKECPELFLKFKEGDWVINEDGKYLHKIGFDEYGEKTCKHQYQLEYYHNESGICYRHATHSEIKSRLIKLAKEKGFKEGVNINRSCYNHIDGFRGVTKHQKDYLTNNYCQYDTIDDSLRMAGFTIYLQGKWATIIEEPKVIELTIDDIASKYGVDVSQIKIKK